MSITSKLEALYRFINHTHELFLYAHQTQNKDMLRILTHGGFYGTISDIKEPTNLLSDESIDEEETTKDHIFSPQRYAPYFFFHIKELSLEEFINLITPLCLVVTVTKAQNTQLMLLEKSNKADNKFVLDKYEQMGITLWRGYEKIEGGLPDDILSQVSQELRNVGYFYSP